jgi:hypothetical protein
MKTKMTLTNLKKMAVTVCSALVLTTGSFTQSNAHVDDELNSMIRLEAFMNSVEHSAKFVALLADETDEITPAMERLEILAGCTQVSLQYTAPAAEENEELVSAIERLEMLAASTEKNISFKAPLTDEIQEHKNDNSVAGMLVADHLFY